MGDLVPASVPRLDPAVEVLASAVAARRANARDREAPHIWMVPYIGGVLSWVSLELEPYYLRPVLGAPIFPKLPFTLLGSFNGISHLYLQKGPIAC